jgi:hypothetical protein
VLCLSLCAFIFTPQNRAAEVRQIDFNREIRPILSDKCIVCHGPDAAARKLGLRLDTEAAATAELSRGRRAIVPGSPEKSEIVNRINHPDEELRMPPKASGHTLTAASKRVAHGMDSAGRKVATALVLYHPGQTGVTRRQITERG